MTNKIPAQQTNDIHTENKLIFFQYLGKTGMTFDGRASGKRYHFHTPGTILPIDEEDYTAMTFESMLKEIKLPFTASPFKE